MSEQFGDDIITITDEDGVEYVLEVLAVLEMDGTAIITADHGNADKMTEEDGSPFTAHTTNPVPFCVVGYPCQLREGGRLCDIAPTMLKILGIDQPADMDGISLIK